MTENLENGPGDHKWITCANCEEQLTGKTLNCSACKETCYCNRSCQRNHWRFHKNRCKQLQEAREVSIALNKKRLYRLFHEWKDESRQIMVECMYGMFGWEALASMEPMRLVINVKVDFDYNNFTFVTTEPPSIVPVSRVYPPTAAQINTLYDESRDVTPPSYMRNVELAPVISVIEYDNESQLLIQTNMIDRDDDRPSGVTFQDLVYKLQTSVTLTSKKREKWMPLKRENLQKQIKVLQNNPSWKDLLVHSLRLRSPETRSLSQNTVVVRLNEGCGLGEIKSLKKLEVAPSGQAKKEYKRQARAGSNNRNGEQATMDAELFGSETAATVLFMGTSDAMCHVVTEDLANLEETAHEEVLSLQESDRKALEAFVALSRVNFPSVTTPPLK